MYKDNHVYIIKDIRPELVLQFKYDKETETFIGFGEKPLILPKWFFDCFNSYILYSPIKPEDTNNLVTVQTNKSYIYKIPNYIYSDLDTLELDLIKVRMADVSKGLNTTKFELIVSNDDLIKVFLDLSKYQLPFTGQVLQTIEDIENNKEINGYLNGIELTIKSE